MNGTYQKNTGESAQFTLEDLEKAEKEILSQMSPFERLLLEHRKSLGRRPIYFDTGWEKQESKQQEDGHD